MQILIQHRKINKNKKVQKFDLSYFVGKSYIDNDGS